MLDSSADDRNPVLPFIPVIDEALGRLRYFPICHQRGLLHSSEIGFGESALGNEPSDRTLRCAALSNPTDHRRTFPDRSEHGHFEA
jgi:hypothetical protein